ncbi:HlyU family transcriptional regulator [uncultured Bartonella sp.]|uniref:HlyU family transcriptional regulator n=1 Tax=uncultured Bartonella sp. TaxID=104108 RepID=UPI0026260CC5|nr:HlyU family transcriptional regulator [uncultured Bartonella sp.]
MSFLAKLFGKNGGTSKKVAPIKGAETEYKGFTILATPYENEGQLQSCGVISKVIDGEKKEQQFIRADRFTNKDDAIAMIHIKARQIIDEQGEKLFQ